MLNWSYRTIKIGEKEKLLIDFKEKNMRYFQFFWKQM